MATRRHSVEKTHMSSAPNRIDPVLSNQGGPELAVSDNANVRGDGFVGERPVRNASPATYGRSSNKPSVRVPKYPQDDA